MLKIIEANPAATNFYGYNHEELIKMNISDINILEIDLIKKEMQKAVSQERKHFEFKHRLSNGKIRDVDIHSGLIPYKNSYVLCSVIHDVTEQKIAEKKQRKHDENVNKMLNIEIGRS